MKAKAKRAGGDHYKRDTHGRFSSTNASGAGGAKKKARARLKKAAIIGGAALAAAGVGALAYRAHKAGKTAAMHEALDAAEKSVGLSSPEGKVAFIKAFKAKYGTNQPTGKVAKMTADAVPDAFKSATKAAAAKIRGIPAAKRTVGQANDLAKLASQAASLGGKAKAPGANIDLGALKSRASGAGKAADKLIKAKARTVGARASGIREAGTHLLKAAARSAGAPIGRAVGAGAVGFAAGEVASRAERRRKKVRARKKKAA